jgi:hypothetical protein
VPVRSRQEDGSDGEGACVDGHMTTVGERRRRGRGVEVLTDRGGARRDRGGGRGQAHQQELDGEARFEGDGIVEGRWQALGRWRTQAKGSAGIPLP